MSSPSGVCDWFVGAIFLSVIFGFVGGLIGYVVNRNSSDPQRRADAMKFAKYGFGIGLAIGLGLTILVFISQTAQQSSLFRDRGTSRAGSTLSGLGGTGLGAAIADTREF